MEDLSLIRFIVMPIVGTALGIRDGRLDSLGGTKPFEYKVGDFAKATIIPLVAMTTVNVIAQATSELYERVNYLEAIGMGVLCGGILYTLSRNISNTLFSRKKEETSEGMSYGTATFILIVYCIVGLATCFFVAKGSPSVSTPYGHVLGDQHQIASRVPGEVVEVFIQDNQLVEAGQPLVRVDDARFRAVVALLEATLKTAEAARDAVAAKLAIVRVTTEEEIKSAKANLASAEARQRAAALGIEISEAMADQAGSNVDVAASTLALLEFQKVQIAASFDKDPGAVPLVRKKSSESFFTSGEAAVDMTTSIHTNAKTGIQVARQLSRIAEQAVTKNQAELEKALVGPEQVKQAESELASAEAAVAAVEAKLEVAKLNLSYCLITAPASGYITHRSVEVGNFLKPQQPLMAISGSENLYVYAKFREPDLYRIKVGQEVAMTLPAAPDQTLIGEVQSIDPTTVGVKSLFPPDNATGQYVKYVQRVPVKIRFKNEEELPFKPMTFGLNVTCEIVDPEPNERLFK